MNAPQSAPLDATSTSASSSTIIGSLPPNSSTTGSSRRAAASATRFPVATLPVKISLSMAESVSAAPAGPSPMTTCIRSGCKSSRQQNTLQLQRDQRRELRRLQHDGVARDQSTQRLNGRSGEGIVPRRDDADHAVRLAHKFAALGFHREIAVGQPAVREGSGMRCECRTAPRRGLP